MRFDRYGALLGRSPALAGPLATLIVLLSGCAGSQDDDETSDMPVIAVEPAELDFGDTVLVNTSSSLSFVVSNVGSAPFSILNYTWSGDSAAFQVPDALRTSVAPGESFTFNAIFSPSALKTYEASLFIENDTPDAPALEVTFRGSGYSPDDDQDGFPALSDCDDGDPSRNPDAQEVCNGIDDDCDGEIDDDAIDALEFYPDEDGDGYGDPNVRRPTSACPDDPPDDMAPNDLDCNDGDASIHPEAVEICTPGESVDENCDGQADEGFDANGDGIADCQDLDGDGFTGDDNDCDDDNPSINPGATEIEGNGVDDNCNGITDENAGPQITMISPTQQGDALPADPNTAFFEVEVHDETSPETAIEVTFRLDDAETLCAQVPADADGYASCTAQIPYGGHELQVEAEDAEGGVTVLSWDFVADNPPVVTFESPESGAEIQYGVSTPFVIKAIDPDGDTLDADALAWSSTLGGPLVPDTTTPADDEGVIVAELTLIWPGEQEIVVDAVDSLGAVGQARLSIEVVGAPECSHEDAVAFWTMNEGSGQNIYDNVDGLEGQGTSITWEPGYNASFGSSLGFDADQGSRVEIKDPDGRLQLETFTIDFWYFASGAPSGDPLSRQTLVYRGSDQEDSRINYWIDVNEQGYLSATMTTEEGIPIVATASDPSGQVLSYEWYYVALTFDGETLRLYANGVEVASTEVPGGLGPSTADGSLYLGIVPNDSSPRPFTLTGFLDELRLLPCPIIAAEISAHYASAAPY